MPASAPNSPGRSLAVRSARELSDSGARTRSVRSAGSKRWQPPEGLGPEDVKAVIAAAATERDRLLLRVLWATGARISEALALRPRDVQRDALVMPNRKNLSVLVKRVFLPEGQAGLPGALLLWAREQGLGDDDPLFFSRKRGSSGERRALRRGQGWLIVRRASELADVHVLALRESRYGAVGEPAPVHPHVFRHARVRQIVRTTKSLPLAQRQAGWSRLQLAYLSVGDEEAREMMRSVKE